MKLLFDENLSPRLVGELAVHFPGSEHVLTVGMNETPDEKVWLFARAQGFTVVSKDSDYLRISSFMGSPPKFIWLHIKNGSWRQMGKYLVAWRSQIEAFDSSADRVLIIQ